MSGKRKLFAFMIVIVFVLSPILIQSVGASSIFVFNKNLQAGDANTDVKELQKFLNNNGFVLNESGVGSSGQETNFFGPATKNALIRFQKTNKITPAVGYFGPISRNAVNKIAGSLAMSPVSSGDQVSDNQPVSQAGDPAEQNIESDHYHVGGSITGITGAVVLQNNGKDDITIDIDQSSDFTFPTALADGADYNVTVKSEYSGQTCYVHDNSGIVRGSDIASVRIACGTHLSYDPFTYIFNSSVTSYSLVYVAGAGGAISGAASQTVNSGNSGSAVTAVPGIGYSFVSWSDGVLTAERIDSAVAADKSVSATFAIDTYDITFDANGSTGGTKPDDQTKTYGVTLVLSANSGTLVKTGHTFSGWNTLADGTGTDYAAGADYVANVGVTLYAKWTINTYTVTFDTNGGDGGSTSAQTLDYDTPTALTTNGFTRTGYTFAGWATTSDGAVAYADRASYTIGAGNVTLFAKWDIVLAIGSSYQGGKVAYILQAADPGYVAGQTHGLIAATADQSMGIVWALAASQSTTVPGGTSTAIGSGSANTDKIIAQNGSGTTYAAGLARAYAGGGYHDWYLPSYNEIAKLFISKDAIGGFEAVYYWSSSEISASAVTSQSFWGNCTSGISKNTWTHVRAVRSF